jgi:hypothetical protein
MSVASPDHCTQRRPDIIDATSIIERFHRTICSAGISCAVHER